MSKYISKFWVTVTVLITAVLWITLFPKMLDKYGLLKAGLLSLLLVFGMFLAYIRGYWVSTLWNKESKSGKGE